MVVKSDCIVGKQSDCKVNFEQYWDAQLTSLCILIWLLGGGRCGAILME